ncbi:MAG TPA: hypothetical protein VM123_07725, partial [archaeon]|nr:hypothetical protein [archaeon]
GWRAHEMRTAALWKRSGLCDFQSHSRHPPPSAVEKLQFYNLPPLPEYPFLIKTPGFSRSICI